MAKSFRPTFAQLALVDWLYERKGCRFVGRNAQSTGTDFDLYETGRRNPDTGRLSLTRFNGWSPDEESEALTQRLGGSRGKIDLSGLLQQKILKSGNNLFAKAGDLNVEAFIKQLDVNENFFHYNTSLYLLHKETGYAYWEETGRDLFEKMKAKRAEDRAKVQRLVLVGKIAPITPDLPASLIKKLPEGMHFPIPDRRGLRPQAWATVVRETDKRLFLEDITPVRKRGPHEGSVIQGHSEKHVDREHVIIDGATPEMIDRICALDAEFEEDVSRIATEIAERMLPIMQDMASRFRQKDAERDEMMREMIEQFASTPSNIGGPKGR